MSFCEEINDLQCSICLRQFYDPIILDCGHTFDGSCIQQMIDANKTFNPIRPIKCPLCNYLFDSNMPLISNKSLASMIKHETTYEWFLIDISSELQKSNIFKFLQLVFNKRDLFEYNHITFETDNVTLTYNPDLNFEQALKIKSLTNLERILQDISDYVEDKDGLKKICIITDGFTKHSKLTKVNSDLINKRFIIHIGDKYVTRTRQLADQINFQFGYFNEKTLEIYVKHFITNF